MDLPPLGGTMKEPFEIKVYEIDDVERLQRRKEGIAEVRRVFGMCVLVSIQLKGIVHLQPYAFVISAKNFGNKKRWFPLTSIV